MRRKDILDKIFEKVVEHLGCYREEENISPYDRDSFIKALCNEIGFNSLECLPYEGGEKMIDLATMLSKDESNEDKVEKQCSNCKWRSSEDITQQIICNNYWSENFNSIIDGSDTCEHFELDKNMLWTNHKKYFGKPFKVGG